MKPTLLAAAVMASLAMVPQASPRGTTERPHIEPLMRLQPLAGADDAYELLIYGDIGESWWGDSVTAQSVVLQLNELPATVATINVRINSYGGSVADGLAIYNALKRHGATKAVTVDGVAMSSASLIAMAGDTVHMPATSILMIHAPWGGIAGNAKELRQYADVLDTFAEGMADAYVVKSGKSRADILGLLQDGADHYYTGAEAVAEGFADAVDEDAAEDGAADEQARAFAAIVAQRVTARGASPQHAGMAIAAAMRTRFPAANAAPASAPLTVNVDPAGIAAAAAAALAPNPPAASAEPTPPADAGNPTGDITMLTPEQKQALAARRDAIRAQFATFESRTDLDQAALATLRQSCEDDTDMTAEQAGAKLLAFLGSATPATPSAAGAPAAAPTGSLTQDETVTYREGAFNALLHRANPSAHRLEGAAVQFRGMDLMDMARDSVERAGHRTRGMSKQEIAIKALQSTSDFPAILGNTVNRSLRAGYDAAPRTFLPFSRQATLPDFKEISRVQLGGAPSLKRVVEGGEYEQGSIGEGAEKYRVHKYGRIVALTWETIVNDDLDALSRIPFAFGASASDLESDLVYAILTNNPNMADGVPLFHATHGNLGTAAKLADALDPSKANPLAAMRKAMRLQKGIEGRYITVNPQFLILPPSLEEVALKATNAAIVAAKGVDLNVTGVTLTPIVEPRLEDGSAIAWFGAASPGVIDTIEYAYLEGHEGVFTETKHGFEVDGVQVKCRHVFGAKAIDHRGFFMNAGLA
ncbi:ClpP-like prohead protease/major capsid protein fusion protein [Stenotrophomonas sp. PS02298]|uniref:ClpP-like prohead protease/major capsid protein fusion protein n=2 Tax=unclassified Stenotrophomonas TaxID=196198 RepID=UPI00249C3950|nr:ClpP-like prohead protease/major capsid protein fusion protein [Stenotrophomonas sp. PS02298]